MTKLPVFTISGRIAVGKTTVSAALAEALNLNRTGFGDEVRARAADAGRESSREVLQEIGEHLVASDPQGFCAAVLARGGYRPGAGLIVDGIRHIEILELLRTMIAPDRLLHVHVEVSDQLRELRIKSRNRPGETTALAAVEGHSTEQQVIDGLPQRADIVVNSSDSADLIVSEIRRLI